MAITIAPKAIEFLEQKEKKYRNEEERKNPV